MSDDEELPPTGGMGDGMGMGDDMSDGDGDDDYHPPVELPEGVKKEILTFASGDSWKKPKTGDEVTVHYVGTLESDGSEFDSSRGRGKPFEFTLGKGQVIKGWDLGVASMKKGELAKFTLSPEFAYGEAGSPPKIPANAVLVFEVELISWASKDDLFGDEGVIKSEVTEGTGWKTPKMGDEVLVCVKVEKADGTTSFEKTDLEYTLGSESMFGDGKKMNEACDKALAGMKRGEEASLKISGDYADGVDGGATATLTLKEMFESKDVSYAKDKSLMKKQVKEGEGYSSPKDGAKCTLSVESATDGSGAALSGFTAKVLEFTAGNGEICDALEFAVAQMKKGERAVLTSNAHCRSDFRLTEALLGVKGDSEKVVLTLELQDFDKPKETYDMSEEEKLEFGAARKDVGATLFKAGRLTMALERYKKVVELFNYIDNFKDDGNKQKAKDLKKLSELNKAAVYLKLADFSEAKKACNTVLKDEGQNVKALYRCAQAELGLKNFGDCIHLCKKVVDADAQNKEARVLLKQAQAGQKEEDKQSKGLFANMCKALGKGPIPPPFVAKKEEDDMDDDEDDDAPMDDAGDIAKEVEKMADAMPDAAADAEKTAAA